MGKGRAGRLFDDRARSAEKRSQWDEDWSKELRQRKDSRDKERRRWEMMKAGGRPDSRHHPARGAIVLPKFISGTNTKPGLGDERYGDRWGSEAAYGASRGGPRRSAFNEGPPPNSWDPYRV